MQTRTDSDHTFAISTGPRTLALRHESTAKCAPDGVVVAITYCGVCGTDLHAYTSGGLVSPSVFGHEWTGVLTAVGADVTGLAVGQRVVACVGPACGHCPQCLAGHTANCDAVFADATGATNDAPEHGGFAEQLAVNARRVMPVLDGLSDEQAALVEPAAVTFHAVRRAQQVLGALVVVQGAGPIGLLTAQYARQTGAGAVIVVEPSEARRAAAESLGFSEVFAPGTAFRERLNQLTAGLGADVLYECSGVASLFQPSAELVRRGGQLSLLGFPMDSSQVSYGDWQARELTVIGSVAYNREDFAGAMRSIANGGVRVEPLITATIALSGLTDLLDDLDSGQSQHAKVLVDPRR
jgi:(R,R)-butanediol dehydrogenase/meso-butanediol dehydrogenase/diacetyl reductase